MDTLVYQGHGDEIHNTILANNTMVHIATEIDLDPTL